MPESDPPGRVVRLSVARPAGRRGGGPPDVARRLAVLERQVERALASAGAGGPALPSFDAVLDGLVGSADRLRRAFGGDAGATVALLEQSLDFLYQHWWRVEVIGRERLPPPGPAMVVANRAPMALPYDALILARALAEGGAQSRPVRPLIDAWLLDLPLLGPALAALGAQPATVTIARRALRAGETVLVFPEGQGAIGKTVDRRYRLQPFGQAALLRAAADAGVPVVPVALVGAEEARPVVWRIEGIAGWLGLPVLPISPAPFPLPTKWTVHVGESLAVPGTAAGRRRGRPFPSLLRERLQGLLSDAVGRRAGVFG